MAGRRVLCIVPPGADAWICTQLAAAGWQADRAADLTEASRLLREHQYRVGLVVWAAGERVRAQQFDKFVTRHPGLEWVGAFSADALAQPAWQNVIFDHLFDHHTLPLDTTRLGHSLGHAYGRAELRSGAARHDAPTEDSLVVGRSAATTLLQRQIRQMAKVDAPVLVCGESGSGKELAAQAIHQASARAAGPFVPVNCAAIQSSLALSELFGYMKGAFTGATADKRGYVEAANTGTLFLDEIGDLPLDLQATLLRFLQEKTILRVGATREIEVDVRVIAATNVNLDTAVRNGRFREDLYYRLNVLPLSVPPLRERKEDIAALAQHWFEQFAHERRAGLKGFSRCALLAMEEYPWPGNVRELVNRVRRAMVLAEGRLISMTDLGFQASQSDADCDEALHDARAEAERSAISTSLHKAGRNVTAAAKQLGVSRMTLYRLMAKHGMSA